MKPRPRHSKCGRSSNTSRHHLERPRVALVGHDARVLVLDLAAALGELREDHVDRLEHVERLEARDHDRLAVVGRDELERPGADHGGTWPGPMKPSRRRSGESSSARSGGTIVTWLHMQEEVLRRPPPSRA